MVGPHEAEVWRLCCGSQQNSRYGFPSPPPGACFMQIPASESLLFFPSQKGKFWPDLEKRPKPCVCDRVGMVLGISVLSVEATLLHSSGVIPCACTELW